MQKVQKLRRMIIVFIISISFAGCNKTSFKEVTILPGNEYSEPLDPATDDSDQILTDYIQFPDSIKLKIEKIFPGGTVENIAHWGPFRYILYRKFPDQHIIKIYIYLTGEIYQALYLDGEYVERPGNFFKKGTEKFINLTKVPQIVLDNNREQIGSRQIVKTWVAESSIGPTYVLEVVGFQKNDTTAFAYRPDGVFKTLSEASRMRRGVERKWTQAEIEELLGQVRLKYCVDSVLCRIRAIPYNPQKGFRFIVFSDNQLNRLVWEAICKSVNKQNPVFAVAGGDLTDDGRPETYQNYYFPVVEQYPKLNVLPVVGNHDTADDGLAMSFITSFGAKVLNYCFDYGNARFVMLDNVSRVTSFEDQLQIADQWLADTPPGFYKFVFFHMPPGDIKKWAYHSMDGKKSKQFTELMAKHKVDQVFTGHIHAYSTANYLGVNYTIAGGAGGTIHEQYGPKGSRHHYVIVDITTDGIKQRIVQFQKID